MKYSYDEKCLDLARYFYPNQSIAFLEALAQALQDCVEGREDTEMLSIPDFLRNQENLRAERAGMETVPAPTASFIETFRRSPRRVQETGPVCSGCQAPNTRGALLESGKCSACEVL